MILSDIEKKAIEMYNEFQSNDRQRKTKAKYLLGTLHLSIDKMLKLSGSMKYVKEYFYNNYSLDLSLQTYYHWYRYYSKSIDDKNVTLSVSKTTNKENKTKTRNNILGLTQIKEENSQDE